MKYNFSFYSINFQEFIEKPREFIDIYVKLDYFYFSACPRVHERHGPGRVKNAGRRLCPRPKQGFGERHHAVKNADRRPYPLSNARSHEKTSSRLRLGPQAGEFSPARRARYTASGFGGGRQMRANAWMPGPLAEPPDPSCQGAFLSPRRGRRLYPLTRGC